ncbi:MAG: hypothetical protein HWN68_09440 [Desulfobacterales bacterium]|nr:hypothetical protein [Desulfobacterales bacterium]
MKDYYHTFHIPVMGIGHSVDTPVRVAPLGITSVISLVDDILLEKIRKYYCEKYGLPYVKLSREEEDGRAKRITAYLETVREIVGIKMEDIRRQPFFEANDKGKYFDLLPEESSMKRQYNTLLKMKAGPERNALAMDLTRRMQPGSIDVNIMVKLDCINPDNDGNVRSDEFSDAKSALRGYAKSGLRSSIVFSAGINQSLFKYMTGFRDFYRDETGEIKKKIILKVSDFRSALIQGRFLAKKGLEVYEFRIESGLNCGGHAFPCNGNLLPCHLRDFKEKRELLTTELHPLIKKYYKNMGWRYPESALNSRPLITVQGGIGTHGEVRRLREDFCMDLTGWASPFLLVPEATCVDVSTRKLLKHAGDEDLYLSDISPLGIPFNNVRKTGSEIWTRNMAAKGKPGSQCPKCFLISNTEFTKTPICLASRQYQKRKLEEIKNMEVSGGEKERLCRKVVEKTCICDHLGNGALIALGIAKEKGAPQLICPGPNIAWFNKICTLKEMVDHIYGRGPALVSSERPHMFAKEIVMYVDYFEKQVTRCTYTPKEISTLQAFKNNLEEGMDFCLRIAQKQPYQGENLASIPPCVERQRTRLKSIYADFEKKVDLDDFAKSSILAAPGAITN